MSPSESKILTTYADWHAHGVGMGKFLRPFIRSWFIVGVLVAAGAFLLKRNQPTGSGVIWGMLFGAILRDIGYLRKMKIVWPVLEKIIDWGKVQSLTASR